jgi:hypothetical protein
MEKKKHCNFVHTVWKYESNFWRNEGFQFSIFVEMSSSLGDGGLSFVRDVGTPTICFRRRARGVLYWCEFLWAAWIPIYTKDTCIIRVQALGRLFSEAIGTERCNVMKKKKTNKTASANTGIQPQCIKTAYWS